MNAGSCSEMNQVSHHKANSDASHRIGIICGSGSKEIFAEFRKFTPIHVDTPYGETSSQILLGELSGRQVAVLFRHGRNHEIPPHKINYRANIWALHHIGASAIVALTSVGGIRNTLGPGAVAIPNQLIDYTYGRANTYFEGGDSGVGHLEMANPFCEALRSTLISAADEGKFDVMDGGVYAVTQGPRFETSAEVSRLAKDGADMVGMTAMPEASLAAELELCYACISLSVNFASGVDNKAIRFEEIHEAYRKGSVIVEKLVKEALRIAHHSYSAESTVFRL